MSAADLFRRGGEVEARIARASLDELAVIVAEEARAGAQLFVGSLERVRNCGCALLRAKEMCGHGRWLLWLEDHFPESDRTAQAYMQLAREWSSIAPALGDGRRLSISDALRLLASPRIMGDRTNPQNPADLPPSVSAGDDEDDPFAGLDEPATATVTAPDAEPVRVPVQRPAATPRSPAKPPAPPKRPADEPPPGVEPEDGEPRIDAIAEWQRAEQRVEGLEAENEAMSRVIQALKAKSDNPKDATINEQATEIRRLQSQVAGLNATVQRLMGERNQAVKQAEAQGRARSKLCRLLSLDPGATFREIIADLESRLSAMPAEDLAMRRGVRELRELTGASSVAEAVERVRATVMGAEVS